MSLRIFCLALLCLILFWERESFALALTASIFEEDRERIYESGCDDIVNKPFHEKTIFTKLAEHLGVIYKYEEIESNNVKKSITGEKTSLTQRDIATQLAQLPKDLSNQLYKAVIRGIPDLIYKAIAPIE